MKIAKAKVQLFPSLSITALKYMRSVNIIFIFSPSENGTGQV